jgi:AraC family transcriptional activator of pobA
VAILYEKFLSESLSNKRLDYNMKSLNGKNIPVRYLNTTHKELDFSGSFSIREVRNLLAGKDMVQELHRHDFFYILALKKGFGNHEIDFASYKIRDKSIFIMRPGQVHQLTLKTGSTGYLMEFRNDFYSSHDKVSHQILRAATDKNFCHPDANAFKQLMATLASIFKEYTNKQERYQVVIKANLEIFFIELLRHGQNKIRKNITNTYVQEQLAEFYELLETHVARYKQVLQYADMLNISNYQLNAITKATLGKTCSEVIDEHVILEAKRYLLATSNQVTQIAYLLGYEDVSYFVRFFRKHTGFSPEAFRNNFR